MTLSVVDRTRPFAEIWNLTRSLLTPLGLTPAPLDTEFSGRQSSDGQSDLTASAWMVGDMADCRFVRILGKSSDIVNTMIFPRQPRRLPVFAAEFLVFGNCPRLAFIDLQVPGMEEKARCRVQEKLEPLAGNYRFLAPPEPAPEWAVHYSTGGFVYARPEHADALACFVALYRDYLACWVELAHGDGPLINDLEGDEQLSRYKADHLRHTPGKAFLEKRFGAKWAHRFLNQFLYG